MAFLGLGNGTMYAQAGGYQKNYRQGVTYIGFFNGATNNHTPSGSGFTVDGFTGITWNKNIVTINFPFFDSSMGTPYSGQLFPTGTSVGSVGQVYPTRG